MAMPQVDGDAARRFVLDEEKARAWLARAEAATAFDLSGEGEDPAPGEDLPEIDDTWDPLSPGNEIDIYSLVRCAVDSGIISRPKTGADQDGTDTDLEFEYIGDDDGGAYCFLVYLGPDLKLASPSCEMRKLGEREARGASAAAAILHEAVASANTALSALDAHTVARMDRLAAAAGELWNSTGGHDPHDVLSAAQREALDMAAAMYRASFGEEDAR